MIPMSVMEMEGCQAGVGIHLRMRTDRHVRID